MLAKDHVPPEDWSLFELRRQDQVLASLQQMLACKRRGLCLMHEWFRRYGTSGSGCRCYERFEEHVLDRDSDPSDD